MILHDMNNINKTDKYKLLLRNSGLSQREIYLISHDSIGVEHNKKFSKNWSNWISESCIEFNKSFNLDNNIFLTCIYTAIIHDYTLIRFNDNFYINVNSFLKFLYNYIINLNVDLKILKNFMNKILSIMNNHFKIELIKANLKDKWPSWLMKVDLNDCEIMKEQKYKGSYLSYKPLKDWTYINSRSVIILIDSNSNVVDTLITTGKFLQDNHIYKLYNEELVKNINRLQNISYKINTELFIKIFEDIELKQYLKELYEKPLKLELKKYFTYILKNIDYYRSSHPRYSNQEFEQKFLRYVHMYIMDNSSSIDTDYKLEVSELLILKFILNYDIKDSIYTYLFIDYRGRLNVKGNISYIASKLLRFVINLNGLDKNNIIYNEYTKYYLLSQMIDVKNICIEDSNDVYDSIIDNFNDKSILSCIKRANYLKIKNNLGNTISLDATSSMMQIIGVLTKNIKLMTYTNLIEGIEKKDIYQHIISKLIIGRDCNDTFYNLYNNRSLIKYVLMLFTYGSTPLYTARRIIEIKNVRNIHVKDLTRIVSDIVRKFNEEFPVVQNLKSLVNKKVKLNKECDVWEYSSILKDIRYTIPKKKVVKAECEKINIKFSIATKESDFIKLKKSAFVNIIHSLDSDICIMTRTRLLKEYNIPSLSIHDCFLININHYNKCLESYNISMKALLKISISDILKDLDPKGLSNLKKYNDYDVNKYNIEKCKYSLKPE